MSYIKNRIYLGSEDDALNPSFLQRNDIRYILEVNNVFDPSKKDRYRRMGIEYNFINYSDDNKDYKKDPQMIPRVMKKSYEILNYYQKRADLVGGNIIVHCQQGRSRSTSVVVNYFILHNKSNYENVYVFVKSKRREIWVLWPETIDYLKSISYY